MEEGELQRGVPEVDPEVDLRRARVAVPLGVERDGAVELDVAGKEPRRRQREEALEGDVVRAGREGAHLGRPHRAAHVGARIDRHLADGDGQRADVDRLCGRIDGEIGAHADVGGPAERGPSSPTLPSCVFRRVRQRQRLRRDGAAHGDGAVGIDRTGQLARERGALDAEPALRRQEREQRRDRDGREAQRRAPDAAERARRDRTLVGGAGREGELDVEVRGRGEHGGVDGQVERRVRPQGGNRRVDGADGEGRGSALRACREVVEADLAGVHLDPPDVHVPRPRRRRGRALEVLQHVGVREATAGQPRHAHPRLADLDPGHLDAPAARTKERPRGDADADTGDLDQRLAGDARRARGAFDADLVDLDRELGAEAHTGRAHGDCPPDALTEPPGRRDRALVDAIRRVARDHHDQRREDPQQRGEHGERDARRAAPAWAGGRLPWISAHGTRR